MSFGLDPSYMSPEERLAEICELLAQGLIRLKARQSSSLFAQHSESSLDFLAHQSGHANRSIGERRDP
jgi:hypothetical protein